MRISIDEFINKYMGGADISKPKSIRDKFITDYGLKSNVREDVFPGISQSLLDLIKNPNRQEAIKENMPSESMKYMKALSNPMFAKSYDSGEESQNILMEQMPFNIKSSIESILNPSKKVASSRLNDLFSSLLALRGRPTFDNNSFKSTGIYSPPNLIKDETKYDLRGRKIN